MKVSFDGLRKSIALAYNDHARTIHHLENINYREINKLKETCEELRTMLGFLMIVQDEEDPDDCNDLSDSVNLISILPENSEAGE